jgi:hypothetical protein
MWMIFGVGFYSFTIGNLSSVLATIDNKSAILKQKLLTLTDYSRKIAMRKDLECRIRHFIENSNKDSHSIEDQERLL